jgi:nucleoside-diphosphate-sugar epimerase
LNELTLVTGATGFIGGHLVAELRSRGVRVRAAIRAAVDSARLPDGVDGVVVGSIGSTTDWAAALSGVDVVYHLAGLAHQPDARMQTGLSPFMAVNEGGTRSLAQQCAASRTVKRIVFVSSMLAAATRDESGESGEGASYPATPYGHSKLAAEHTLEASLARGRPDWTIIRPPLVYGPGNPGNMARLLQLTRLPLPLPLGGIANRRSFLYVGNLVDLLMRVAHDPRASRQVFPAADDEIISTPELIRMICRVSGHRARLFPVPDRLLRAVGRCGDILGAVLHRRISFDSYSVDRLAGSLVVDTHVVRDVLGWRPSVSMEEGLARTLSRAPYGGSRDHGRVERGPQ